MNLDMVGRIPPQDLDAEMAVLGCLLLEGRSALAKCGDLRPTDFYTDNHRVVFEAMLRLATASKPVDMLTVTAELAHAGDLELADGPAGIALLQAQASLAPYLESYAEIVRERAQLREVIQEGAHLVGNAYDVSTSPRDLAMKAAVRLVAIADRAAGDPLIGAVEMFADPNPDAPPIVQYLTGLSLVDDLLGGVTPGHLAVIAGRPGMGKSALGCAVVHYTGHRRRVPTLFLSLEMSVPEIAARVIAHESGIDSLAILRNRLTTDEQEYVAKARARLRASALKVQRKRVTMLDDVLAVLRAAVVKHGAKVVILDHLGRISIPRAQSRYAEAGDVAKALKTAAQELDVALIALCQLNRAVEGRDSQRPRLSDLRDSGRIEEEADEVLMLWTTEDRAGHSDPEIVVNLALEKSRHGPTGRRAYRFCRPLSRFAEIAAEEPRE